MRNSRLLIFFTGCAAVFFFFASSYNVSAAGLSIQAVPFSDADPYRPNEVLVKLKGEHEIRVLKLPQGSDVAANVSALQHNGAVEHAEPNFRVHSASASVTPNDQLYQKQQYLSQIGLPEAWALTTGIQKVTVAVLDSGVDINHPDLKENIWLNSGEIPGDGIDNDDNGYVDDVNGWDFINNIPDVNPKFGGLFTDAGVHHGTLLSGIVGAVGNNKIGIAGTSWHSKIMPLRVLNNRGEGDVLTVVKALDYVFLKKVDVVNLSFVGDGDSSFLRDALKRLTDAGTVIVTASGNDETNNRGFDLNAQPLYPACYHFTDFSVISVAALDPLSQKASFSNYGSKCIDISAPGIDIMTTQVVRYEQPGFTKFYGDTWSGSSLSTAIVSGVVALMKSANPTLVPADVLDILKKTCSSVDAVNPEYSGKLGCGQIQAGAAVQEAIARLQKMQVVSAVSDDEEQGAGSLVIAPADGSGPLALYSKDGARDAEHSVRPFGSNAIPFTLAVSPDGAHLVVGAGPRGGPQVRVFDHDFQVTGQFIAYDKKFRGGVIVGVADVDGDGQDDIVTLPGPGSVAEVKVFTLAGKLKEHFFAEGRKYLGGFSLALGDLNNDGIAEILLSPLTGPSQVKVFHANGSLTLQFAPYPKTTIGAHMVVGDTDGDGVHEIITAPAKGKGAVKVFSSVGSLRTSFYPFGKNFRGGITLAAGDFEQSGRDAIVATPTQGGGPHVRILHEDGSAISQFFAFKSSYSKGLLLSIFH